MGLRCVLAGTSEGTRESKEFKCELAFLDFAAPSDPVGSVYSENPSSVEGGDVE